ncbi:FAD binding domain-containing protein [Clostridium estertheticum]|uniref:FAD binding domain-containing protein n=1 Tax=Clostridium estertheticum TaxID=238834 RepID=UPI0013E9397D|nr:FAD binding domain-containing protein [Clostridium estertheticum]MBZ9686852.1 FAD binding domain-containing protein [Clostridium estertheticum]
MIALDFEYYKPDSLDEAVKLHRKLSESGKDPLYYSGGTEIITMARRNDIFTKAVIDIKGIPECNVFETSGNQLIIGATVTLTHIAGNKLVPFLSKTANFPADHTARNMITVGGNICGKIIYKEAILGHLIADSNAIIYGEKGKRIVPINRAFNQRLQLEKGELLFQLTTDMSYSNLPHVCIKKTKQEKIDYPLISMAALKKNNNIQMAFSGVCAYPFRSIEMEEYINNKTVSKEKRIEQAISHLPAPIFGNIQGSSEYKKFVLKNLLDYTLETLDGEGR